jgi:hypothetical protein
VDAGALDAEEHEDGGRHGAARLSEQGAGGVGSSGLRHAALRMAERL